MQLAEFVSDPEAPMRRTLDGRGLRRATLLIALLGVAGAVGPLYFALRLLGSLEEPSGAVLLRLAALVVVPVLNATAAWVVYAGLSNTLARLYDGDGRLVRLLRPTAWALVPVGLGYLVRSLALVASVAWMPPETLAAVAAGATQEGTVSAAFEAAMSGPVVLASTAVLAATILWSGYVLSFAVEYEEGIPRRDALRVAMVPAGIYALYEFGDALETAGAF